MSTISAPPHAILDMFGAQKRDEDVKSITPLDIAGTVDKFTGQVAFTISLFNYPQASTLSVPCKLKYSSSVKDDLYKENNEKQTGWVGLGWNLNFGRIVAAEQRTASEQLNYFLDASVISPILCVNGRYLLRDRPNWKIITHRDQDYQIRSWEIIDETGVSYHYGECDNATRYVITDGNHALSSTQHFTYHSKLPYAWDLRFVKNRHVGPYSEIAIEYEKDELICAGSATGVKYTRASYYKRIIDTFGRVYEFIIEERDSEELVALESACENGPGFQQINERHRLREIRVLNRLGGDIQKRFIFHFGDHIGEGWSYKSLLAQVEIRDYHDQRLPGYEFKYVQAGRDNPGALEKITYPSGMTISYEYFKYTHRTSNLNFNVRTNANDFIQIAGNTVVHLRLPSRPTDRSRTDIEVFAYYWDGHRWQGSTDNPVHNITDIPIRIFNQWWWTTEWEEGDLLQTADEFFALRTSRKEAYLFHWEHLDSMWHKTSFISSSKNSEILFAVGAAYAAFIDTGAKKVHRWMWTEGSWITDTVDIKIASPTYSPFELKESDYSIVGHRNYFLITSRDWYLYSSSQGERKVILQRHFIRNGEWEVSYLDYFFDFRMTAHETRRGMGSPVCSDFCVHFHSGITASWDSRGRWKDRYMLFRRRDEEFKRLIGGSVCGDACTLLLRARPRENGTPYRLLVLLRRWVGSSTWIEKAVGPFEVSELDPRALGHVWANTFPSYAIVASKEYRDLSLEERIANAVAAIQRGDNPLKSLAMVSMEDTRLISFRWLGNVWSDGEEFPHFFYTYLGEDGHARTLGVSGNTCLYCIPSRSGLEVSLEFHGIEGELHWNKTYNVGDWCIVRNKYVLVNRKTQKHGEYSYTPHLAFIRNGVIESSLQLRYNDPTQISSFIASPLSTDDTFVLRDYRLTQSPRGWTHVGLTKFCKIKRGQVNTDQLNDYLVRKVTYSAFLEAERTCVFEYKHGNTGREGNTSAFGQVEVTLPNTGKIVTHYFNGLTPNDPGSPEGLATAFSVFGISENTTTFKKLIGLPYREEHFDGETGDCVRTDTFRWSSQAVDQNLEKWRVYKRHLLEKRSLFAGVKRRTTYLYNDEGLLSQKLYEIGETPSQRALPWRTERYRYAYKTLPPTDRDFLKKNNILSFISQITVEGIPPKGASDRLVTYSKQWSTWKWSQRQKRLSLIQNHKWIGNPFNNEFPPVNPRGIDARTDYVCDSAGRIIQIILPEGERVALLWGYHNYHQLRTWQTLHDKHMCIGIIKNAKPTECFLWDFEGTENWILSDHASIKQDMAYVGKNSLKLVRPSVGFSKVRTRIFGLTEGLEYRLEMKVKGRGVLVFISWEDQLGERSDNSSSSTSKLWDSLIWVFTAPCPAVELEIALSSNAPDSICYCDHLRVYPNKALAETYTVDPIGGHILGVFDENFVCTRYSYDSTDKLETIQNDEGAMVLSMSHEFPSKKRLEFGYVQKVRFPRGNLVRDWSFSSDYLSFSNFSSSTRWLLSQGCTSQKENSFFGESCIRMLFKQGGRQTISASVHLRKSQNYCASVFFKGSPTVNVELEIGNSRKVTRSTNRDTWNRIFVFFMPHTDGWHNVSLIGESNSDESIVLFDGVVVEASNECSPVIAERQFFNAYGEMIQKQWLESPFQESNIPSTGIQMWTFGSLGKIKETFRPWSEDYVERGLVNSPLEFIKNAKYYCLKYFSNEENTAMGICRFPYSTVQCGAEPSAATTFFWPMGMDSRETDLSYRFDRATQTSESEIIGLLDQGMPHYCYSRLSYIDPAGRREIIWNDTEGHNVGWISDSFPPEIAERIDDGTESLTSLIRRDSFGRVVEQISPQCIKKIEEQNLVTLDQYKRNKWAKRYQYDSRGYLVSAFDADSGETYYVYDRGGRVRYIQTPEMRECNRPKLHRLSDGSAPSVRRLLDNSADNVRKVLLKAGIGTVVGTEFAFSARSNGTIDVDLIVSYSKEAEKTVRRPKIPRRKVIEPVVITLRDRATNEVIERQAFGSSDIDDEGAIKHRFIISYQIDEMTVRIDLINQGTLSDAHTVLLEGTITVYLEWGRDTPEFKELIYDEMGRLTKSEIVQGNFLFDTNYPGSGVVVEEAGRRTIMELSYGENYHEGTGFNRNRICRVRYINVSENSNRIVEEELEYNKHGLLQERTVKYPDLSPKKILYDWNELGLLVKRAIEPDRMFMWYKYDWRGRLKRVYFCSNDDFEGAKLVAEYKYFPDGRLYTCALGYSPDQQTELVTYGYHRRGWPLSVHASCVRLDMGYSSQISKLGHPSWISFWDNRSNESHMYLYSYDNAERLKEIAVLEEESGLPVKPTTKITYDDNGNLKTVRIVSRNGEECQTYIYSDILHPNRLTKVEKLNQTPDGNEYRYGSDGKVRIDGMRQLAFEYNDSRFLERIDSIENDNQIELTHDYGGRLIRSEQVGSPGQSGEIWHYLRDQNGILLAAYRNHKIAYWNLVGHGVIGRQEAVWDNQGKMESSHIYYYVLDHLARVRAVLDGSTGTCLEVYRNLSWLFDRDEEGEVHSSYFNGNELSRFLKGIKVSFLYGRVIDKALRRWLQPEPLDAFFPNYSPYVYANNNDVRWIDYSGLQAGEGSEGNIDLEFGEPREEDNTLVIPTTVWISNSGKGQAEGWIGGSSLGYEIFRMQIPTRTRSAAEIDAIDVSDSVGKAADLSRPFSETVYMRDVRTMVDEVVVKLEGRKLRRLNVIDHGNSYGLEIGQDWVTVNTLNNFRQELVRLRQHFDNDAFVHLQHCNIGNNFELLIALGRDLGSPSLWGGWPSQPNIPSEFDRGPIYSVRSRRSLSFRIWISVISA